MVRIIEQRTIEGNNNYIIAAGKHTDSKPVGGLITGSLFLEVDTGDVYAYDESSSGTWNKIREGYSA